MLFKQIRRILEEAEKLSGAEIQRLGERLKPADGHMSPIGRLSEESARLCLLAALKDDMLSKTSQTFERMQAAEIDETDASGVLDLIKELDDDLQLIGRIINAEMRARFPQLHTNNASFSVGADFIIYTDGLRASDSLESEDAIMPTHGTVQ